MSVETRKRTFFGKLLHLFGSSSSGMSSDWEKPDARVFDEREGQRFAQAYSEAVERLGTVEEVRFRDSSNHLDVYTLYRGDLHSFQDQLYGIEAAVADEFPNVPVDWHVVSADRVDKRAFVEYGSNVVPTG